MKLFHISDLHLGKRVFGFSLLEEQSFALTQILGLIEKEQPDALLIAGDIYDKPVPPAEAVSLFDGFLNALAARKLKTFIISGNHDSAERLAFGGRLMDKSGIHFAPVYDGVLLPHTLSDEFGALHFYLLPFVRPAQVRAVWQNEPAESYTEALSTALSHVPLDAEARNLLITHQFVTGSVRSESEELSMGGTDNVDASLFQAFDYVALGHLHSAQAAGGEHIRYSGSPLCYSFSEAGRAKSVTVAELREKGSVSVRELPLTPLRPMLELRGSYMELTALRFYEALNRDAYFHITLTDEEDIPDAVGKLRVIYPRLMRLDYDNRRTGGTAELTEPPNAERKTPQELFAAFYEQQNHSPLGEEQAAYIAGLIEEIREEER